MKNLITASLCLAAASAAPGQVIPVFEFERAADAWLPLAPGAEAYAFDEFYPGLAVGMGCLVDPPDDEPKVVVLASREP